MEDVPCERQTRRRFLHDSLLEEILVRLPIKSIFRFKSVSKQWFSLSSGPSFVQRKIASSSSLPWTILYRFPSKYGNPEHLKFHCIASLDFTSPSFSILSPYSDGPETDYRIVSTCRKSGLLLLRDNLSVNMQSIYHLCNPITSQWFTLPPLKCEFFGGENIVTQVDDRWCLTSFKVVIVNKPSRRQDTRSVQTNVVEMVQMDIFSSETKEWMSIKVDCPQHVTELNEAILFNGILHHFTYKYVRPAIFRPAILVYDPYTDSKGFRLIECPKGEMIRDLCCVSHGRLIYLCCDFNKISFKKWVLEDYDDGGKWHLEGEVQFIHQYCKSRVSLHPFNSDILYVWYCGFKSFNMQTGRLDNVDSIKVPFPMHSILYVFPMWPMSLPLPLLSTDAIVHS